MAITNHWLFVLKLFAALGCGLIAGVFFAFSSFVMNALARLQPKQGISAMQLINITVINPSFMAVFLGTAAACIFLTISSFSNWHQPSTVYLLVGSLFYLIGTLGVTMVFNVPLNDSLANVEPGTTESANLWASYITNWTICNHIRAVSALVASALLIIALCYGEGRSLN